MPKCSLSYERKTYFTEHLHAARVLASQAEAIVVL